MTSLSSELAMKGEAIPPPAVRGTGGWRAYAGSPGRAVTTALVLGLVLFLCAPLSRWAVFDATWSGTAETCRAQGGACWAFVADKFGMSLFGLYPYAERWRPTLVLVGFASLAVLSMRPMFWSRHLLVAWGAAALAMWLLMRGGVFGLPEVSTRLWGGLTLTIFVSIYSLAAGLPGGIVLALGRRSSLPVVSWTATLIIEAVRGVPLISLIFLAAILWPLFLPAIDVDRLVRIQIAFAIFASAYLAEVFRGGLDALPQGQEEAAKALGLGYAARTWLVVLPQVLKSTIPAQVNTFIVLFKDTSLVVIVGIFDLFTTVRAAIGDPRWLGFSVEGYVYTGAVYLILCLALSRYSQWLEVRLNPQRTPAG